MLQPRGSGRRLLYLPDKGSAGSRISAAAVNGCSFQQTEAQRHPRAYDISFLRTAEPSGCGEGRWCRFLGTISLGPQGIV